MKEASNLSKKVFSIAEQSKIEERFDYADLVRRRIEDCGKARGRPDEYPLMVQALEELIPDDDHDERYDKEKKEAENTTSEWVYTYWRGKKQGTPENPILKNDPKNWETYDPDMETSLKSPIEVPDIIITDWGARFRAAFNLLVRLGVAVRRSDVTG